MKLRNIALSLLLPLLINSCTTPSSQTDLLEQDQMKIAQACGANNFHFMFIRGGSQKQIDKSISNFTKGKEIEVIEMLQGAMASVHLNHKNQPLVIGGDSPSFTAFVIEASLLGIRKDIQLGIDIYYIGRESYYPRVSTAIRTAGGRPYLIEYN